MLNNNSTNFSFIPSTIEEINNLTSKRDGETKIGENISTTIINNKTKFLLLGIEESVGPQVNKGMSGAQNGFNAFINRFMNMQSNRFLKGDEIVYIGRIQQNLKTFDKSDGNKKIVELDDFVFEILSKFLTEKVRPIIIGGGHNNAFPIIKTLSKLNKKAINVINMDPHADCRPLEGRHSGNPFSYAKKEGYLDHYTVFGLHKAYNSEFILDYLDENNFNYTFFEDYIDTPAKFEKDIEDIFLKLSTDKQFGLELDMDAIQNMPSSAFTPSGFTLESARFYIRHFAKNKNCCYLHLPEGAPTNLLEDKIIGKALAYLVWDYISTHNKNNI